MEENSPDQSRTEKSGATALFVDKICMYVCNILIGKCAGFINWISDIAVLVTITDDWCFLWNVLLNNLYSWGYHIKSKNFKDIDEKEELLNTFLVSKQRTMHFHDKLISNCWILCLCFKGFDQWDRDNNYSSLNISIFAKDWNNWINLLKYLILMSPTKQLVISKMLKNW